MFAQHFPSFGYQPIILTVHEKYYEEKLDWKLNELLPKNLRIEKVDAFKATKPRLIGDIGLRAFFKLYKRAKQLIQKEKIAFLYIPIPSFYVALLGRWLHYSTGIKYGIDYIDPWVHYFPGSDKMFSRHWFSTKLASFLEPIAVKKASLITGVAEGYFKGVQERNPQLVKGCLFAAMPYGGEVKDHEVVRVLDVEPYLFRKNRSKLQLVYAGAMLPKAFQPLEEIFKSISNNVEDFSDTQFHFIGTGKFVKGADIYTIKPLAEKYGLWNSIVFEYAQRIPYFDVLIHLRSADGVFILGSTEPHYTPSKVYQAVLSKKPILAVLHQSSTACKVLRSSGAGVVLDFDGEDDLGKISGDFPHSVKLFRVFVRDYNYSNINQQEFEKYSARNVTKTLADSLNKVV